MISSATVRSATPRPYPRASTSCTGDRDCYASGVASGSRYLGCDRTVTDAASTGGARRGYIGGSSSRGESVEPTVPDDTVVLIVEDDASVRAAVSLVLERAGFVPVAVHDGESGIAIVREDGADAVLLDLMLPGLDGYEVCTRLRETSDIPIVMLTARTETDDIVRGLEAGADDY